MKTYRELLSDLSAELVSFANALTVAFQGLAKWNETQQQSGKNIEEIKKQMIVRNVTKDVQENKAFMIRGTDEAIKIIKSQTPILSDRSESMLKIAEEMVTYKILSDEDKKEAQGLVMAIDITVPLLEKQLDQISTVESSLGQEVEDIELKASSQRALVAIREIFDAGRLFAQRAKQAKVSIQKTLDAQIEGSSTH